MNSGTLLSCPICQVTPHPNGRLFPQILGRLMPNGQLVILRFRQGTTVIQSGNVTLQCGCGFSYYIEGNHVMGTAMLPI